jgi:hypothetical protein
MVWLLLAAGMIRAEQRHFASVVPKPSRLSTGSKIRIPGISIPENPLLLGAGGGPERKPCDWQSAVVHRRAHGTYAAHGTGAISNPRCFAGLTKWSRGGSNP